MPIKIPDSLPARATLEGENIFVMTEYRAIHQDMRPLNLLILNLMPTKIVTETQLLRKLSHTYLIILQNQLCNFFLSSLHFFLHSLFPLSIAIEKIISSFPKKHNAAETISIRPHPLF